MKSIRELLEELDEEEKGSRASARTKKRAQKPQSKIQALLAELDEVEGKKTAARPQATFRPRGGLPSLGLGTGELAPGTLAALPVAPTPPAKRLSVTPGTERAFQERQPAYVPAPPERPGALGFASDVARALASTPYGVAEMAGRVARQLPQVPMPTLGNAPPAMAGGVSPLLTGVSLFQQASQAGLPEQMESIQQGPALQLSAQAQAGPRRWVTQAIQSFPQSIVAGVPGATLGGALGGIPGGIAGYMASGGTLMGLAQYDRFISEAQRAGIPITKEVNKQAIISALAEGIPEALSNAVMGGIASGVLKPAAKAGLKQLAKRFAINYLKTATSEVLTEMPTAWQQARSRLAVGLPSDTPWEEALGAIGPTLVSSLGFGALETAAQGTRTQKAANYYAQATARLERLKKQADRIGAGILTKPVLRKRIARAEEQVREAEGLLRQVTESPSVTAETEAPAPAIPPVEAIAAPAEAPVAPVPSPFPAAVSTAAEVPSEFEDMMLGAFSAQAAEPEIDETLSYPEQLASYLKQQGIVGTPQAEEQVRLARGRPKWRDIQKTLEDWGVVVPPTSEEEVAPPEASQIAPLQAVAPVEAAEAPATTPAVESMAGKATEFLVREYGETDIKDAHNAPWIASDGRLVGNMADHDESARAALEALGVTEGGQSATKTLQRVSGVVRLSGAGEEIGVDVAGPITIQQINTIRSLVLRNPTYDFHYDIYEPGTETPRVSGSSLADFLEDVTAPATVPAVEALAGQAARSEPIPSSETPPAPGEAVEPALAAQKQPWEMTQETAVDRTYPSGKDVPDAPDGATASQAGQPAKKVGRIWQFQAASDGNWYRITDPVSAKRLDHQYWVAQALAEGKPVPPEVLADYPDLQPAQPVAQPPVAAPESSAEAWDVPYGTWRESEHAKLRAEYPDASPEDLNATLPTEAEWAAEVERGALKGTRLPDEVLDDYRSRFGRDAFGRVFRGVAEQTGYLPPEVREAQRDALRRPAVPVVDVRPSPAEEAKAAQSKVGKSGFSPAQKEYLSEHLRDAAETFAEDPAAPAQRIHVPGDGDFTVGNKQQAAEMAKLVQKGGGRGSPAPRSKPPILEGDLTAESLIAAAQATPRDYGSYVLNGVLPEQLAPLRDGLREIQAAGGAERVVGRRYEGGRGGSKEEIESVRAYAEALDVGITRRLGDEIEQQQRMVEEAAQLREKAKRLDATIEQRREAALEAERAYRLAEARTKSYRSPVRRRSSESMQAARQQETEAKNQQKALLAQADRLDAQQAALSKPSIFDASPAQPSPTPVAPTEAPAFAAGSRVTWVSKGGKAMAGAVEQVNANGSLRIRRDDNGGIAVLRPEKVQVETATPVPEPAQPIAEVTPIPTLEPSLERQPSMGRRAEQRVREQEVATPEGRVVTLEVEGEMRVVTLTPEQTREWNAAEAKHNRYVDLIRTSQNTDQFDKDRLLKAEGMEWAAEKRKITGILTVKEQKAQQKRADSMFSGKRVQVGTREGIVTATPFGRVSVKLDTGEIITVPRDQVTTTPAPATTPGTPRQTYRIAKSVTVTNTQGKDVTLPAGEEYTVYPLEDGKVRLQDGKQVTVFEGELEKISPYLLKAGEQPMAGGIVHPDLEVQVLAAYDAGRFTLEDPRLNESARRLLQQKRPYGPGVIPPIPTPEVTPEVTPTPTPVPTPQAQTPQPTPTQLTATPERVTPSQLTHATSDVAREDIGLSARAEAQPQTEEEWKAGSEGLDIERIVTKGKRGEPLEPNEHARLAQAFDRRKGELDTLDVQMAQLEAAGARDEALRLASEREGVKGVLESYLDASDASGTAGARSMRARQMFLLENQSAPVLLHKAKNSKGSDLTPEETAQIEAMAKQIAELEAEARKARTLIETQAQEIAAMNVAAQKKVDTARRQAKNVVPKQRPDRIAKIRKEREQILKDLQNLGQFRVYDITGLTGEASALVTRLAASYIHEGALTIAEVTSQIRQHLPDLNDQQILEAIGAKGKSPTPEVTERGKVTRGLREEARLRLSGNMQRLAEREARQLLKGGVVNLQDIVDKLREVVPNLSDYDAYRAIAGPDRKMRKLELDEAMAKARRDRVKAEVRNRIDALKPRSSTEKIVDGILDVMGLSTAMAASGDVSAVGRQGFRLVVSHPVLGARAIGTMFKAVANEAYAHKVRQDIEESTDLISLNEMGVELTEWDGSDLTKKEEGFVTNLLDHVRQYTIGRTLTAHIPPSSRAFATFNNVLRKEVALKLRAQAERNGHNSESDLKAIGNYINVVTGRGNWFKSNSRVISRIFWAPRLALSQFEVPFTLLQGSNATKKMLAGEMAKWFGGTALMVFLADLSPWAEVEWDPRSSEVGQIKIGPHLIDPWAGLRVAGVFAAQYLTGTKAREGEARKVAEDYIVGRFLRSKLGRLPAQIHAWKTGVDFQGNPSRTWQSVATLPVPLAWTEIYEAGKSPEGAGLLSALGMAPAALGGFGVTTYDKSQRRQRSGSVKTVSPEELQRMIQAMPVYQ